MKKTYMIPQIEIVDEDVYAQLLAGSLDIDSSTTIDPATADAPELFEIDAN